MEGTTVLKLVRLFPVEFKELFTEQSLEVTGPSVYRLFHFPGKNPQKTAQGPYQTSIGLIRQHVKHRVYCYMCIVFVFKSTNTMSHCTKCICLPSGLQELTNSLNHFAVYCLHLFLRHVRVSSGIITVHLLNIDAVIGATYQLK